MKRSEIKAKEYEDSLDYYHYTGDEPSVAYQEGYEQAEKDTIQRIKELLKVRIVERTERCQEDWSNRQKDRVNIRNDEDGDIILVLEKLGEE